MNTRFVKIADRTEYGPFQLTAENLIAAVYFPKIRLQVDPSVAGIFTDGQGFNINGNQQMSSAHNYAFVLDDDDLMFSR